MSILLRLSATLLVTFEWQIKGKIDYDGVGLLREGITVMDGVYGKDS